MLPTGEPSTDFCRVLPVQQKTSFFLSLKAGRADCIQRNDQAYISLAADDGQTVKLTITDFNRVHNFSQPNTRFEIEENGQTQSIEFTNNDKGDMEAEYISSSSRLTLVLKDLRHNALISYQCKCYFDDTRSIGRNLTS